MGRVYNFSAGPSMLPEQVLKEASGEMLDYKGTGMSVMEMSHRSKAYISIIESVEARLRKLMSIPHNYKVLFLQGGAYMQFGMVPMNLMTTNKKADYVNTGGFSKKAITEAKLFGTVNVAASSEDDKFTYIPKDIAFSPDADYVHITSNNTIEGTRYVEFPKTGSVPLVADMSSNILSEEIDVTKFGLIYAGSQKNLGPAGVAIVIVRDNLLGKHPENTPSMLRYSTHAEKGSMFNTPPTYTIYLVGLVLKWLEGLGGVKAIEAVNRKKAQLLYDLIDRSDFYTNHVNKEDRSLMNVIFFTPSEEMDKKFISEAQKCDLYTLKGYRTVGGIRASIYNAMPVEAIEKLVEFMSRFERNK